MKKFLALLLALGILCFSSADLQAATINEIIAQVNAYKDSGDIRDPELATGLYHILRDAGYWESIGDMGSRNNFLEAFKVTVEANSGDMISAGAASVLIGMVP